MHPEAQALVRALALQPHPEGGYFRETYRSRDRVTTTRGTDRNALTTIYYLLTVEGFAAFHRLSSDETWHFYRGDELALELIDAAGRHETRRLGPAGPWQTAIPAGTNFAAHVDGEDTWALLGCDVAPGFEFSDFLLTTRAMLTAAYPQHGPLIAKYTR
jgi:predicted cupin superfamily sugar epimerase